MSNEKFYTTEEVMQQLTKTVEKCLAKAESKQVKEKVDAIVEDIGDPNYKPQVESSKTPADKTGVLWKNNTQLNPSQKPLKTKKKIVGVRNISKPQRKVINRRKGLFRLKRFLQNKKQK